MEDIRINSLYRSFRVRCGRLAVIQKIDLPQTDISISTCILDHLLPYLTYTPFFLFPSLSSLYLSFYSPFPCCPSAASTSPLHRPAIDPLTAQTQREKRRSESAAGMAEGTSVGADSFTHYLCSHTDFPSLAPLQYVPFSLSFQCRSRVELRCRISKPHSRQD